MSAFGGLIFTNKGRNLQAKAQAGAQLNFTRIAVGDGELGGSAIADLNALVNQVKSISITKLSILAGGKAVAGASFSNQDLLSGFYWKELGVFAQDPDLGEILYCYGNSGANAEYIPAGGGPDVVEKSIDVVTIVGNAANVTATIEQSLVYYTQDDVLTVDQTQVPATPGNGKISQLFNWLANRIIAITGKPNWWDAPSKSLEDVAMHVAETTAKYENITANGQYVGEVTTEAVAADGALYDLLYLSATGYNKAQANADATIPCLAMRVEIGTGNRKLLKSGYVRNDVWNWTKGQLLYVSPTAAGAIVAVRPSVIGQRIQIIGYAVSPDIIYFDPDYTWIEI